LGQGYDVILVATPQWVKPLKPHSNIDVLEKTPEQMSSSAAIVVFHIDSMVKGEFEKRFHYNPSLKNQALDAVKKRQIWKILTANFLEEEEIIEKEWLRIAVDDPYQTFGLLYGEEPEEKKYRLYLKKMPGNGSSYILLKTTY